MANTKRRKPGEEEKDPSSYSAKEHPWDRDFREEDTRASCRELSEGENLLATESKPAEVKMYQDGNLMANEREAVEKKGSLEVAGKDDEKYQIYESIAKKEISSATLVLDESMYSLFYDANEDIESSFRNDHKSPEYFSFQQELPETDSKGSSMIRESNVEFYSTRTPLSTARLEEMVSLSLPVKDLSENDHKKGRKENQTLELDALEPSCKVGSQGNFTANVLVNLSSTFQWPSLV
ncbi:hypothetical protein SADUNF_Sadunf17G0079200 [Salix dunnii]|uniref:Uncharacterized protein n=1 Tax=Salix dunnii TaxID=1413687 RepID=A0A835J7Z3_9ROSI|nr:hypothetical protein SADUNF_Sadunf17G0079200 [Salix dunnii]